jgi:biotin carboxyl carrier protein
MNVDRIEKLVRLFGASRAGELLIEADGWRVAVRRSGLSSPPPPAAATPSPSVSESLLEEPESPSAAITAPLVGIFRQGERAVQVGDTIAAGQMVGSIESMKILNPVVAEVGGEVLEVLIEDGVPVEFGQALYRLWPSVEPAGGEEEPWTDEVGGEAGR